MQYLASCRGYLGYMVPEVSTLPFSCFSQLVIERVKRGEMSLYFQCRPGKSAPPNIQGLFRVPTLMLSAGQGATGSCF